MPRFATAAVHYFKVPRSSWDPILDRLAAAGFDGIDIYVPWGVHETGLGRWDFGERQGNLDLAAFLGLVEERGLCVILRPGPHVNAELPNFGLPDRIVRNPDVWALSPRGNPVFCPFIPHPFPAPSYASTLYLEETEKWYRRVGEVTGEFFGRKNFVRMVQVDNEASMFFRDGPFDQDYRPEAVALFRAWLEEQGLEPRDPPTSVEEGKEGLCRGLEWLRFRHVMVCRALERMKRMLERAGMGSAPFSHNLPPSGIFSSVALGSVKAAVDRVTTDLYSTARDCRTAMDQVLLLSSVEKEPFAGEMGAGTVFYTPYVTEFDNKFMVLGSLACGLRGFNVYMGTARDRWLGGLVTEAGTVERSSLLHFYQRLLMLMDGLGMDAFSPLHGAAVLLPRVYLDHSTLLFPLAAVSPILVQGFGMSLKTFLPPDHEGLGAAVQIRWLERLEGIMEALRKAALFYALAESPGAPDWAGRGGGPGPVLLVPTFEYIDSGTMSALIRHAEGDGLVLAGPERPRLDERMQPLDPGLAKRLDALAGEGRILFPRDLESGGTAAGELEKARASLEQTTPVRLRKKHPLCEFVLHGHATGKRWLLFVVHRYEGESAVIFDIEKGWSCERVLHLREGGETGEFSKTTLGRDRTVILEQQGYEISLIHFEKEMKKKGKR